MLREKYIVLSTKTRQISVKAPVKVLENNLLRISGKTTYDKLQGEEFVDVNDIRYSKEDDTTYISLPLTHMWKVKFKEYCINFEIIENKFYGLK